MFTLRQALASAAAALSLAACGPKETPEPAQNPSSAIDAAQDVLNRGSTGQLDPLFAQAAREFDVPADLLKAISFTETRWQMVHGEEEFEGMPAAHGLMALRGEAIVRGAALAGVSAEQVRTDAASNIRAAAALLSSYAEQLKVDRKDLGAWAPAVVRLSGISSADAQAGYVHRQVYSTLRNGVVAEGTNGQVTASIMPTPVEAKFAQPSVRAMAAGPDYAESVWHASPNYGSRPAGTDIQMIVIHTCEGEYSGCWGWLTNSAAQASAHYVVNESGSEISQLVAEANRAWHVAASYDCTLNSNVMCGLNTVSVNHFSVGIEHAGFASQTSFPTGQIDASAKLSCNISKDQTVVRDSYHIVGHGKLQPNNRTDPGPNWPWSTYISKVKEFCNDAPAAGIVVDTNNANNNASVAEFKVSSNWTVSSGTPGYYGSNYYFASTEALSDPATFRFNLAAAGTKTVQAWWTAGTNRSSAAPFIIWNADGTKLGTVYANQQANGGKWVTLGTFNFSAGWNEVQLSRWAAEGYVVIADAIRIE
ncbi:golvesin C-terminal-like domain-containing protein [Hyalangium versicolor]|uniref:golvesin C-terminal-like domain-containing protein n=1 Tax=Hyalangium versicolor TaxID=2861190 RepID=UPI001CCFAD73|nr:N-acetylmuramoyl-L-alanine amidase [Hyalangium versicolor]